MKNLIPLLPRLAVLSALFFPIFQPAYADEGFIEWQTANIQLLQGWNYAGPEDTRTLVSAEYANRWRYGDMFAFFDATRFSSGGTNHYGEFSPRISLSRVTGSTLSFGFIRDVLISANFEKGKSTSLRRLFGGAVDLDIPGFTFFKVNLYHRNDPRLIGSTYQLTIAWLSPFEIGNTSFVFEGFADITGNEGATSVQNEHIVPRLLMDLAGPLGMENGNLYLGVEFEYWHNKIGRPGVTETTPQLQLKWVF